MKEYEIIIIGGGPAGLTSAIYAGRQGNKTIILEKGLVGGVGREVPAMENYPGFKLVHGLSLVNIMKEQCEKLVDIHEIEEVKSIEKIEDSSDYNFKVLTSSEEYLTKAIILSTGSAHKKLNVPGEEEFKGRGVSYCATCDGMFFREKDIVMVGGGNTALQEAIYLNKIGCNVRILIRRDEFRASQLLQERIKELNIEVIYNSEIKEICGEEFVKNVKIVNNKNKKESEINTDAVFISVGYDPQSKLAENLGVKLDETNHIITDKNQKTNIDYVYSAGDITGGYKQWSVACGEGTIAALQAYHDIEQL